MILMIQNWLNGFGLNMGYAEILARGIIFIVIILFSIIVDKITKRFILRALSKFVTKTKSNWDDALQDRKFFNQLANWPPVIVLYL